jgi:hypothetical protein
MKARTLMASGILLALAGSVAVSGPAQALTTKECSAKYQAAKTAGTLNGMKWNDFRKAECGATASATPAAAPSQTGSVAAPRTASPPAAVGNAVFPSRVAAKYAQDSPGKQRMETCLDQYRANKATNANGGLKWIEKGGGYYSECNKRLKGA